MKSIIQSFGLRVKKIREARKMSQESLAEKAGLHRTYVSGIERGTRNPSLINIGKLAQALDISVRTFFLEDDE